jgi:dihydrofolate reductase
MNNDEPRHGFEPKVGPERKETPTTSLARVQFFSVSLDGFGTGEGLSHDAPFGHAGERLHEWMFVTRWWHEMVGEPGGGGGIDDAVVRLHDPGIGAEIMGAGKFGYPGWHEDPAWKGWWGDEPPFHTPVFVLTHHTRPPIEMKGGTTFHFLDARRQRRSRRPARRRAARTYASAEVRRAPRLLAAGLVDHAHIVVVPILLGRGVRLWDGLEGLEKDYQVEAISSPSGVTHVTVHRTAL